MSFNVEGVLTPDSKLAQELTELVRTTAPPLLFHHSSRVYYFGALSGVRRGLKFDRGLRYAGAMFHDMGLLHEHSSPDKRFEVDGADVARDFLKGRGISEAEIDLVWTAIMSNRVRGPRISRALPAASWARCCRNGTVAPPGGAGRDRRIRGSRCIRDCRADR
jgi:HD superfamily phosphodiesterase